MSGGVYIAGAGALLQQLRLEKIANNLSNVSSAGFKKEIPIFSLTDLLKGNAQAPPPETQGRQKISPYTPPYYSVTDFSKGVLKPTHNPLDMAIDGEGFFSIQTDQGVRYTRSGNFVRNAEGILSDLNGFPVMGEAGEIALEGTHIAVDGEGNVSVDGEIIDQLRIVNFSSLQGLEKDGHTLFKIPENSDITEEASENFSVYQGYLELSNVDVVRSMTEMIETSRTFEAYQKMIRTMDDTTAKVVNDVGKVS